MERVTEFCFEQFDFKEREMNRFLKTSILSAAVAATILATVPVASAGGHGWHRGHSDGDLVAAGILGLAAGALTVGVLSQPREPVYYAPASVRPYVDDPSYPPAPARYEYRRVEYGYDGLEPWSREWYRYCESRYRSFDPNSGTFIGYDGREHFCAAR